MKYEITQQQKEEFESCLFKLQNLINDLKEKEQSTSYPVANSKYVYFSDAGHGAIDLNTNLYTTNGKFWEHKGFDLHLGNKFLEGVSNRIIESKVIELCKQNGIEYVRLFHEYLDTSLVERVATANHHHRTIKKGFGISIHSNAANTKARGWCVYTSRGQTQSDKLADFCYLKHKESLEKSYGVQMRSEQWLDKDYDYEANFYMISKTIMPFILTENLFFDNVEDMKLLMNEDVQNRIAQSHFDTIVWGMGNLEL